MLEIICIATKPPNHQTNMKARLEKIEPGYGSSFTLRRFEGGKSNHSEWHFHPEYEIVYISNGKGKRHIANHISHFEDGDLIFLGPHLPHFGFTEQVEEPHLEIVLQMKPDFLGEDFFAKPEMRNIQQLFERSHVGLSFRGRTKEKVGGALNQLFYLEPFDRLVGLMKILNTLARTDEYELLNVEQFSLEVSSQYFDRMQEVYQYVGQHFQEEISLQEISDRVNMTTPAFCRFFKKVTDKTFTQFVNEMRIEEARRLLLDKHRSIAEVSYESGFNNLSHFNKHFKRLNGLSPSEYRKQNVQLLSSETKRSGLT
jgi:AraC-like DNA-binding protein/quercetin dioxygenase-like cupin family protein